MSFIRVVVDATEYVGMRLECVPGTTKMRIWENASVSHDLEAADIDTIQTLKNRYALDTARGNTPTEPDA